jgi:hypothetical protein
MSTYKEDYTVDSLISTLSAFMANHWENARESYYKEGSQAFNALMSETVRPTEILCELIKSRESTDEQLREAAVLKAQKELGKEIQQRVEKSLIKEGST